MLRVSLANKLDEWIGVEIRLEQIDWTFTKR